MDRRRTDRRRQMEMVLASIFLAARTFQNTCSYRTPELTLPANNVKDLEFVNGRKVTDTALIGPQVSPAAQLRPVKGLEASRLGDCVPADAVGGSQGNVFCANPVNGIPGSRTKEIISGHEFFLALLWQAVKRATGGVLAYLEKAELRAANRGERWEADDYRLSQHVVLLAEEGKADPYTLGFFRQYHIHPSKVTWWWRDSKKLLFLAEATNCPAPLLVANRAEEAFRYLIPDFDYSQVSSGATHAERREPLAVTRSGGDGNQGDAQRARTSTARQSGPLENVSPVLPLPARAHPANTPAPVRTTGAGDKEIL